MFKTFDDLKKDNKEQNNNRNDTSNGKTEKDFENQKDANGILKRAEENARKLLFKKEKPNADCIITLYKNGFIINDEQFRDYYDNANLKFMAELNKGLVPQELRRKYPKGLNIGIVDQKSEVFGKDPAPEPVAFTGQATPLSTIPPANTATVTPTNIAKPVDDDHETEELKVDHSKPKTRILIRLHNGKTQEIDVNLTTKLYEIFFYTWNLEPTVGEFELVAGFPPKAIADLDQTVQEAGLEDSKIIQRLK